MSAASRSTPRRPRFRVGAVLALAAAAGLVTWVLLGRSPHPSTTGRPASASAAPKSPAAPAATAVSAARLATFAASRSGPVFWAGPQPGKRYELTETASGNVFVRYLRRGTAVGTPRADFLTIATYPQADAFAAVQAASRRPGAVVMSVGDAGLAVYDRARPTSVYLAYPGGHEQVEVYDPSPAVARRLVQSGRVQPVGAPRTAAGGAPRAVAAATLRASVGSREPPVYWAGERGGAVYELTETADGRVFVRYLSSRRQVGSPSPGFLTVATYPEPDAFAQLQTAARRPGAVAVRLPGGALAVYDRARPTSVYVAQPGARAQVEVFDPSASEALALVRHGKIRPVR